MAYTDNILLTLRSGSDSVDVESFNRDNRLLDELLAPVSEDYLNVRRAANIGAYNMYQLMMASRYSGGFEVPNKKGLMFDLFNEAADSASTGAFHSAANKAYLFGDNVGTSLTSNPAGDVGTTVSDGGYGDLDVGNGLGFSLTAPGTCLITGVELDVSSSGGPYIYMKSFKIGSHRVVNSPAYFATAPTTRSTVVYTLASPVLASAGTVISGIIQTNASSAEFTAYGAAANAPCVRIYCTPVPVTGWVKTADSQLGEGHTRVDAYVQVESESGATVAACIVDGDGEEHSLTAGGVTDCTLPNLVTPCRELYFFGDYSQAQGAIKVTVTAQTGSVVKLLGCGATFR